MKTIISNFHPLEFVGRGSETQLQVGENVYSISLALTAQGSTVVVRI